MTRTMYDGIDASRLPTSAQLVGGYVDGLYAWSAADWARFPNSVKVRIAVFSTTDDGEVLDVEPGNATPAESVDWVLMRRKAGVDPTVYMNTSTWPTVRAAFEARGVPEPHYWVAQYDGVASLPAGAIAKQYYNDNQAGYDLSVVADHWPGVDQAPAPSPLEVPMQDALYAVGNAPDGTPTGIWFYADGRYMHVPTIAERDLIIAEFGVQEKPLPYSAHQILLAVTATAAPVDVKGLATAVVTGLAPVVNAALHAGQPVDYDHLAVVVEAHLAATLATPK